MKTLKEGLIQLAHTIKKGLVPTVFTSNQLIHLCSKHGLLHSARKLFDAMPERNVFTWNAIILAHIKKHDLTQARSLFDATPHKDSVTYNSMISGYLSTNGFEAEAMELFAEMQATRTLLDEFTLTTMLNLTAKLLLLSCGEQLHSFMVKTANDSTRFFVSSLIDMYSKCGCFGEACQAFNGLGMMLDSVSKNAMVAAYCREGEMDAALNLFCTDPGLNDTVSWNTLISGYAHNGYAEEALELFVCMAENGIRYNEHSFTTVLSACSRLKSLKHGKEVHALVLKNGLSSNMFISSGIVDVYCKSGNLQYAELVHGATGTDNAYSITSLIVGHCSQGNMAEARRLFDSLNFKNSVVWSALFSGYVRLQQCEAVFELLNEFKVKEAVVPDALILVSVLGACAIQAALDPGKQIHSYILRMGIEIELGEKLGSAMVDMYAKCGDIKYAERIFQRVAYRDQILYNAMIASYAHHGCESEAILLYMEMLNCGIKPSAVTFIALLSACRHAGLVEAGEMYFDSMTKDYSIDPEIDHYSCMIDLYGRASQYEKVVALMRKIPVELDAVIWGSCLNACRMNGNVDLATIAEEELLKIEGDSATRYVQLANVYAAGGKWSEMGRIRGKMRGKEVRKFGGCSWLYVENRVNVFTSGDRSHSEAEAIYFVLDCLNVQFEGEKSLYTDTKSPTHLLYDCG